MARDGPANDRNNAGEAHVVSGRLVADMLGGAITVVDPLQALPRRAVLRQNYPNPFNGRTAIVYEIEHTTSIELAVYDLLGQRMATLSRGVQTAGAHVVHWDGRNDAGDAVASGLYVYSLRSGTERKTKRLILLR